MKKRNYFSLALLSLLVMPLAGCVEVHEEKLVINVDTLLDKYVVNEEVDFSACIVSYFDTAGVENRLPYSDERLEFSPIDTSTPGTKVLTVTFEDRLSDTANIVVNELKIGENLFVSSFDEPASLTNYQENIKEKGVADKDNEFVNREDGYYVGTANPLRLRPQVEAYSPDLEEVFSVQNYQGGITLEEKQSDGSYVVLSDVNLLSAMEEVKVNEFQFKIPNKEYRFTFNVRTQDLDVDVPPSKTSYSFELKTLDAFNVHNLAELTLMDTSGNWSAYQSKNGISNIDNLSFKGMILHKDITFDPKVLPSPLLHPNPPEGVELELLDQVHILYREVKHDFEFIGNYFQIDATKLPRVLRDNPGDEPIKEDEDSKGFSVNTSLFEFHPSFGLDATNWTHEKVSMRNMSLYGNVGISDKLYDCTGMQVADVKTHKFDLNNVITQSFLCSYNINVSYLIMGSEANFIDSKLFDFFDHSLYIWNCETVFIENTTIKQTGGPALIVVGHNPAQHFYADQSGVSFASNVYVDDFKNFQTEMKGTEAWFKLTNAIPLVGAIKAGASGFVQVSKGIKASIAGTPYDPMFTEGRSFVKEKNGEEWFELKGIVMSPNFPTDQYMPKGTIQVGTKADKTNALGIVDLYNPLSDPNIASHFLGGNQVVQSHNIETLTSSRLAWVNEYGFNYGDASLLTPENLMHAIQLLSGDYLSLYAGNLGVVASYYPVSLAA